MKSRKHTFMVFSDLHLRDSLPMSRTDDYLAAQFSKIRQIRKWWEENETPYILAGGDIFHHWKSSPWVIREAIDILPIIDVAVAGQHDLPKHNVDLISQSSIDVLCAARKIKHLCICTPRKIDELLISGFSYGQEIVGDEKSDIVIAHVMVSESNVKYPYETTPAKTLLKKFPNAKLILTGDNHSTFIEEYKGRVLINPGSVMRMTADQGDHKPCFFEVTIHKDNIYWKQHFLKIEDNVLTREHIVKVEMREKRVEAFIKYLKKSFDVGLSFEDNLKKFFAENNINKKLIAVVEKLVQESNDEIK